GLNWVSMTLYIRSDVHMWSNANDEEKSRLMLDTPYEFGVLIVCAHPIFGIRVSSLCFVDPI
ncbi:MAG: hypothetical protein WAQ30_07765, partial [Bacillota bacterium]